MASFKRSFFALVFLLAGANGLDYPRVGASDRLPWGLSKDVVNAAFASPNATGVYDSWAGTSLSAAPAFSTMIWNVTIAVKEGIPLSNSSLALADQKSKVVTITRVSLAPYGVQPGKPMDKTGFVDRDNSTSVSLCLIMGWRDNNAPAPSAGDSAEQKKAKCSGVDECQKDLGAAIRSVTSISTRKNDSASNCYPAPTMPDSCKEQLGWKGMVSSTTADVAMTHGQLLSGDVMVQWASDAHDPGNLTDYRNALRNTFGVYAYFVYHEKNNQTGNRTTRQGAQYDGFMCAKADKIAEGSQSGASVLERPLSCIALLAMTATIMMAL